MSKWSSRKFWLTLLGDGVGAVTALTGYVTANQELVYGGLAMVVALTASYLKAEKDVDMAQANAEAEIVCQQLYHEKHCPVCNKKE